MIEEIEYIVLGSQDIKRTILYEIEHTKEKFAIFDLENKLDHIEISLRDNYSLYNCINFESNRRLLLLTFNKIDNSKIDNKLEFLEQIMIKIKNSYKGKIYAEFMLVEENDYYNTKKINFIQIL